MKHSMIALSPFIIEEEPSPIKVVGSSMHPYLKDGDIIAIRSNINQKIKNGNCYIYFSNGTLTIHRLLWHSKNWGYFAGDANKYIEKIRIQNIVGEPVIERYIRLQHLVTVINYITLLLWKIPFIRRVRSALLYFVFRTKAFS
ncbi:MAG: hypothetical protein JXB49_04640 [Bacteroidales bacterium]|nr:hypothetical protein [Bacteroidales bacterium]